MFQLVRTSGGATRRSASAASVPLERHGRIRSTASLAAAFAILVTADSVHAQMVDPEVVGDWTGPFDWTCQIDNDSQDPACASVNSDELAHAALLSTGLHAGKILLWNRLSKQACPPHDPSMAQPPVVSFQIYSLHPEPNAPDVLLDSYPRAFQMSNGHILVAGDTDTAVGAAAPLAPNDPGSTWVVKLPAYSQSVPPAGPGPIGRRT